MAFRIDIAEQADEDLNEILDWLSRRSEQGAAAWFEAFSTAVDFLRDHALSLPKLPQSRRLEIELRAISFATTQGLTYHLVFVVDAGASIVRVLRIRKPGQRSIGRTDLS